MNGEVKIPRRLRWSCCVSAVIGLFCRQYDIIKDNDSNNNPKEKGKGPEQSPQGRPVGTRQVMWGTSGGEKSDLGAKEYSVKGRTGRREGWGGKGMSGREESRRQVWHLSFSGIRDFG